MTAVGTIGSSYMVQDEQFYFKDGNIIWFRKFKNDGANYFLYDFMQSKDFTSLINEITIGSTQSAITITTFGQFKLIFPNDILLYDYKKLSEKLGRLMSNKKKSNSKLNLLKELLLSKLATIEN